VAAGLQPAIFYPASYKLAATSRSPAHGDLRKTKHPATQQIHGVGVDLLPGCGQVRPLNLLVADHRADDHALGNRDTNADTVKIEVVYPKSGSIAGLYIQAISAYSPRPNAARLWMEYLYSDAGQLAWLAGYAKPVRYDDLVKNKAIPDELAAKLPKSDVPVAFPTIDQITKVSEQIKTGWPEKVGLAYAAS
jgi:hypothetical protein